MSAIRMRDVTKHYGKVIALDGVDLDLAENRIHGPGRRSRSFPGPSA